MRSTLIQSRFDRLLSMLIILGVFGVIASSWTAKTLAVSEQDEGALIGAIKASKHSLANGIAQSQKENGVPISAKFELEDGALMLSVYTAKGGLGQDAEHNTLMELNGDSAQAAWAPKSEVFSDKEHIARSAMQLTLVQLCKLTLSEAVAKAESAQPGTVYSVIPAVKSGSAVYLVKVATSDGKSVPLSIDGNSGKVTK